MKIRQGFVSNSSSSSFVIVMTKEQEVEWKDKLNLYEKQMLESDDVYLGREEKIFAGKDVIIYSGTTGNYCFYGEWSPELADEDKALSDEEFDEKYGVHPEDLKWQSWETAEEKLPKDVIYTSIDT